MMISSITAQLMKEELSHHFTVKEHNELLRRANTDLKTQLDSYSDKFSDFQGTLTKSNEVRVSLSRNVYKDFPSSHLCIYSVSWRPACSPDLPDM